jgi:hypothetical protein
VDRALVLADLATDDGAGGDQEAEVGAGLAREGGLDRGLAQRDLGVTELDLGRERPEGGADAPG